MMATPTTMPSWAPLLISRPAGAGADHAVADVRFQLLQPDGKMRLGVRYSGLKDFVPLRRRQIGTATRNSHGGDSGNTTDQTTDGQPHHADDGDPLQRELQDSLNGLGGTDAAASASTSVEPTTASENEDANNAMTDHNPANEPVRDTEREHRLDERDSGWLANNIVVVSRPDTPKVFLTGVNLIVACLFVTDLVLLGLSYSALNNLTGVVSFILFLRLVGILVGASGFVLNSWTLLTVFSISCAFQVYSYAFLFQNLPEIGRLVILLLLWGTAEMRKAQIQFFWYVPYR